MVDEELEKWVQEKLDSGVEPERIKKSLENTGKDPSIVDEVVDPFQDEEAGDEESPFEEDSAGEDDGELVEDGFEAGQPGKDTGSGEAGGEEPEGSGFSAPDVGFPALPYRKLGLALFVLLLIAGAGMVVPGAVDSVLSQDSPDTGNEPVEPEEPEKGFGDCPDMGVRISSARVVDGQVEVDALVTGSGAEVVLEVYTNGEKEGETRASFEGTKELTVGVTGNKVVLRPAGCKRISDSRMLG